MAKKTPAAAKKRPSNSKPRRKKKPAKPATGRPAGAPNVDREIALGKLTKCPNCQSTDRAPYHAKKREVRIDSPDYTHKIYRHTHCTNCGQHRVDIYFENRAGAAPYMPPLPENPNGCTPREHRQPEGYLKSPYGYMNVGGTRYKNGHPIRGGRLQDVHEYHTVPFLWVARRPPSSAAPTGPNKDFDADEIDYPAGIDPAPTRPAPNPIVSGTEKPQKPPAKTTKTATKKKTAAR